MARTKMDPIHIQQSVYDEDHEANKVMMVGTEMEIAVSIEDGDSVINLPKSLTISVEDGIMLCEGMKSCQLYTMANSDIKVEVSPSKTKDIWFELTTCKTTTEPLMQQSPKEICAMRVRLSGAGQAYLVLQAV